MTEKKIAMNKDEILRSLAEWAATQHQGVDNEMVKVILGLMARVARLEEALLPKQKDSTNEY